MTGDAKLFARLVATDEDGTYHSYYLGSLRLHRLTPTQVCIEVPELVEDDLLDGTLEIIDAEDSFTVFSVDARQVLVTGDKNDSELRELRVSRKDVEGPL